MNKKYSRESGFGVLEVLLILVIVGLIGFVGWFVWNNRDVKTKVENSTVEQKPTDDTPQVEVTSVELPDDWQWFTSADKSVKFAYPKSWGTLRQESETNKPADSQSPGILPVALLKQSDFPVQVAKGFFDPTWYYWNYDKDSLQSVSEKEMPADMVDRPAPVNPASPVAIEPMFSEGSFRVYHVLGKGAMNCGRHNYFFRVKDSIVRLVADECERGGEFKPSEGEVYGDSITNPLGQFYKYL